MKAGRAQSYRLGVGLGRGQVITAPQVPTEVTGFSQSSAKQQLRHAHVMTWRMRRYSGSEDVASREWGEFAYNGPEPHPVHVSSYGRIRSPAAYLRDWERIQVEGARNTANDAVYSAHAGARDHDVFGQEADG